MSLNRDGIINLVLQRLGNRQGNTALQTAAKTELALIQSRLEGDPFLPWFLLRVAQTLNLTANVAYVALPAGFLREMEEADPWYPDPNDSSHPVLLAKDDYDLLFSRYRDAEPGYPLYYSLSSRIDVFPTPEVNLDLTWWYYGTDTVLSDVVQTNLWTTNADDLLVAELGAIMARYVEAPEAKAEFLRDIVVAKARLLAFDEARMQANRRAYRGE